MAISGDGNTAIIGAYRKNNDTGAAYIFTRSGTTWTQQTKLEASNAENYDSFGIRVAISSDGNTAVVGAYAEDTGFDNAGAVYIFTRTGTTWTERDMIQPSDVAINDRFGEDLSISPDGTTIIVGTPNKNSAAGAAYIFNKNYFV